MLIIAYEVNQYFNVALCFRNYSQAEEEEIVNYVVRHNAYGLVKGTALWKLMEENMVKKSIINIEH